MPYPSDWAELHLSDLAQWDTGGTPKSSDPEFYAGGTVPWANIGDLNDGALGGTARAITEAGVARAGGTVPPGTVLVSMYGTIAKTAITTGAMATNQAIARGRPAAAVVMPEFLFLLIQHLRPRLTAAARGGAQANISKSILESLRVPVPPLEEQRRMVALLSVVDIAAARAAAAALAAQAALEAALRDIFPAVVSPDAGAALLFRDMATPRRDFTPPGADEACKMLTLAIRGRGSRLRRVTTPDDLGTARFRAWSGDLVISKIDARNGAADILPAELDGVFITGDFLAYQPNVDIVDPDYLRWLVRSPAFAELCAAASSGTTNRVRLSPPTLLARPVHLPDLASQAATAAVLGELASVATAAAARWARVQAARAALLTGLMSGRHRIPTTYDEHLR